MSQADRLKFARRSLFSCLTSAVALLGTFGFAIMIRPHVASAAGAEVGQIVKLRGIARLLRKDLSQLIETGMYLEIGDTLLTGPDARLRIKLVDGSIVTLGESSRLILDRAVFNPANGDRDVSISLFDGILRSSVAKVKGRSAYEVKSTLMVSSARSTEWVVELKGPAASLTVLDGTVAATATPEVIAVLPDAPIAKGIELEAGYGVLVGPPTRMLGVPLKDLGRAIKWPAAKVEKFKAATDF
jgi:ferric-dicitrate binding protein FerR (iron transport regulator)